VSSDKTRGTMRFNLRFFLRQGLAVGVTLLSLGGASGCAKDRTLDEWRTDKVNRRLSKIQAISGDYTGTLVSAKDDSSLGNISLKLSPDTRVQISEDRTYTEQQAVVRGKLDFFGTSRAQIIFEQGYYDPDSGNFKATASIQSEANERRELTISGLIVNNQLTGELEASGYPELGAKFTLTKLSRYELGMSSLLSVLYARSGLTEAAVARIRAESQIEQQRITLYRLLLLGEFSEIKGCQLQELPKLDWWEWVQDVFTGGARDQNTIDEMCRA
jgi:hypothetical protein